MVCQVDEEDTSEIITAAEIRQAVNIAMRRFLTVFLLLLSSLPASASEAQDLKRTTQLWAQRLDIAEFKITVVPVPFIFLLSVCQGKCLAASYWTVKNRTGTVFILQRSAYTPEICEANHIKYDLKHIKADQRDSVVHELLHNVVQNMDTEYAVSTLSHAFKP